MCGISRRKIQIMLTNKKRTKQRNAKKYTKCNCMCVCVAMYLLCHWSSTERFRLGGHHQSYGRGTLKSQTPRTKSRKENNKPKTLRCKLCDMQKFDQIAVIFPDERYPKKLQSKARAIELNNKFRKPSI